MNLKIRDINRLHILAGPSCNNNCVFCIDGERSREEKFDLIERKKQIERDLYENRGIGIVSFTGNEPALNPFLPDLVEEAGKLGYRTISIVTNGRRWADKEFCREMIRAGATNITISIHGPDAEIHDGLTSVNGSFSETCQGLMNLQEMRPDGGFYLFTHTVINSRNVEKIPEMLEMFLPLNIDTVVLGPMEPAGRGLQRYEELAPRYARIGEILRYATGVLGLAPIEERVRVEPFPLCVLRGMERLAGHTNIINVRDARSMEMSVLRVEDRKAKGRPCAECTRSEECPGVWKIYSEMFGWDEFTPYTA
jgi:MoaA/NifB/PqqE/SkfB family radical SAM enzyme